MKLKYQIGTILFLLSGLSQTASANVTITKPVITPPVIGPRPPTTTIDPTDQSSGPSVNVSIDDQTSINVPPEDVFSADAITYANEIDNAASQIDSTTDASSLSNLQTDKLKEAQDQLAKSIGVYQGRINDVIDDPTTKKVKQLKVDTVEIEKNIKNATLALNNHKSDYDTQINTARVLAYVRLAIEIYYLDGAPQQSIDVAKLAVSEALSSKGLRSQIISVIKSVDKQKNIIAGKSLLAILGLSDDEEQLSDLNDKSSTNVGGVLAANVFAVGSIIGLIVTSRKKN
jgi:hypothetical protein